MLGLVDGPASGCGGLGLVVRTSSRTLPMSMSSTSPVGRTCPRSARSIAPRRPGCVPSLKPMSPRRRARREAGSAAVGASAGFAFAPARAPYGQPGGYGMRCTVTSGAIGAGAGAPGAAGNSSGGRTCSGRVGGAETVLIFGSGGAGAPGVVGGIATPAISSSFIWRSLSFSARSLSRSARSFSFSARRSARSLRKVSFHLTYSALAASRWTRASSAESLLSKPSSFLGWGAGLGGAENGPPGPGPGRPLPQVLGSELIHRDA